MIGQQPAMVLAEVIGNGENNEDQAAEIKQADANAENGATPVAGDAPEGAIPEALRQKQDCHDRQSHQNSQKNPAPIQIATPSTTSLKHIMPGIRLSYGVCACA
jgi:hypothetical protein